MWCRLQENLLLLPVGSRSLTVIALELLLSGNDFPNSSYLFLIDRVFSNPNCNFFFFESIVKSGSTKRALSFWSASYLSSDLFVKLLKTSRYNNFFYDCFYCMNLYLAFDSYGFVVFGRLIWGSRAMLSLHSRRLLRLISWVCLRTPTCVLFMPRESPSCLRTSSLLGVSVVNVLKPCS